MGDGPKSWNELVLAMLMNKSKTSFIIIANNKNETRVSQCNETLHCTSVLQGQQKHNNKCTDYMEVLNKALC